MADNTTLDSGSGGNTMRTLEDGSGIHHPVGVTAYVTNLSDPDTISIPEAAALADDTANPTTLLHGSCLMVYDGTTWDRLRGDATNGVLVNLGSNNDVTVSGTVTVDATGQGDVPITLDGESVTVTGTVTANLSATDNAVLDTIAAGTATEGSALASGVLIQGDDGTDRKNINVDPSTGDVQVDVTNTVTVDATSSGDVPITLDGESVAVTNSGITTIAGAVSGTEMQVDIVSAPTITVDNGGTFAVQSTLQANSGVDIGDVDVTSVTPGSGASNLGKAEDAAHSSGDVGVMALGVRQDSGAALAGTDGDYSPFQVDSDGNLRVNVAAGGGSGGTSSTDDASFTAGSGSGTPMMAFATSDAVDSGDVGVLAMDTNRNLKVSIEADSVGIGGGTQYTEDAAAPANPVGNALMAERDDALAGLTPVEGDWTHLYCDANGALWTNVNGTVTVDATGQGDVPITLDGESVTVTGTVTANAGTGTYTVDNAGTFAVQVNGDALTSLQLIDNIVQTEDAVHGSGDSGVMALSVRNDTLAALATTDGDYAPLQVNASGALYVQQGSALDVSGATVTVDATSQGDVPVTLDGEAVSVSGTVTVDLGSNNDIQGDVASDDADSGNPIKVGGVARTSELTNVANNDRVNFVSDKAGKQITLPYSNPENFTQGTASATTASLTDVLSAAGAGLKNYVTSVVIANGSATDTEVNIKDGNTTIVTYPAPAGGGAIHTLPTPLVSTANTSIAFTTNDAASTVYVTAIGYTGA